MSRFLKRICASVFLLFPASIIYAAETSAPEIPGAPSLGNDRSLHIGIFAAGTSLEIDDPDGSAETASDSNPANILITSDLYRNKRLVGQMYNRLTTFEAGIENIGQDLTRTGVNVSMQFKTGLGGSTSLWWGGGLGFVSETYEKRHRVTASGSLAGSELEEREENGIQGVVGASFEWNATRTFSLGLHAQYELPFQDTAQVISAGIYLLY